MTRQCQCKHFAVSPLVWVFREWALLKYGPVIELQSRVATSTRRLIVAAAPVRGAFIGVLFLCRAVALLFENHLLACLWQLYSHLLNDLAVLTTLFGLSSSKQHLGLAVFPSLPFSLYLHTVVCCILALSLSLLFSHRHSAL